MSLLARDGNGNIQNIGARGDGIDAPFVVYHSELPATPTTVPSGTGGVAAVAAAAGLTLIGYAVLETADGNAGVKIHHGVDNTGPLLDVPQALAANQLARVWFGGSGPSCPNGIYVERTSGTTELVLYTIEG